jgi:T6SS, Transcription factor, DNA binding domain
MQTPPLVPKVANTAPSDSVLTAYDEDHLVTYLRLLDADAKGADWREVPRLVLHLDPVHESDRAGRAFDSHLSRAKWMTERGYRHLLRGGHPLKVTKVVAEQSGDHPTMRRSVQCDAQTAARAIKANTGIVLQKSRS